MYHRRKKLKREGGREQLKKTGLREGMERYVQIECKKVYIGELKIQNNRLKNAWKWINEMRMNEKEGTEKKN
jgi:hypothetical protein